MSDSTRDRAEQALLGAVLISDTALDTITDERVRPEHFSRATHRALFASMLSLNELGHGIDLLTLKAKFSGPNSPVSHAEIELLAVAVENLSNLRGYCRIVRDEAFFDEAQRALYDAHNAIETRDKEALLTAFAQLEQADDTEEKDNASEFLDWYGSERKAWPLPYSKLTQASGGFVPGEVTMLGGWSGFGKSFLLAQLLRTCRKAGATVHEYANEMHGPKRTLRTLAAMTGVPTGLIESKRLTQQQAKEVMSALSGLPYETTPTAGWPVEMYCRDIRRRKWDVAAIDTVTNLPCSRVDEWDRACVMLADAAAVAGTHLILVSQLNLERDKGKKPPPVGRDLRNTGAWYQRARVVMFIHRDQESVEAGDGSVLWRATDEGHVRIEKASHGHEEFVPVRFNSRFLRFDELEQAGEWRAAA
jgi:replicative DNA helicase